MRPGDVLAGRFALEAHAGAGGMAEVYRARDLERGCAVAIKLLRDTSGADAPRFQREATLLAELEHPRIVRHVTHGSLPSGALYLAMEWLEGEDLSRRLARGRLEVQEAVEIARCVAEALGAAHARGIVHRDLKPSNEFLAGAEPPRDVRLLEDVEAALSHLHQGLAGEVPAEIELALMSRWRWSTSSRARSRGARCYVSTPR